MFTDRAFRTWAHVVMGACLFAAAFLFLMLVAEQVVGSSLRFTRATAGVGAAAFIGYVGTAWVVRREVRRATTDAPPPL
jgi:hypothetical protein